MTSLAMAFKNVRVMSGWFMNGMTAAGPSYRNSIGWIASPIVQGKNNRLVCYVIKDMNGNVIGSVDSVNNLPY